MVAFADEELMGLSMSGSAVSRYTTVPSAVDFCLPLQPVKMAKAESATAKNK